MGPPRIPAWVGWLLRRLLPDRERRIALSELAELREAWKRELGSEEADRRYRRQLRQYPVRLVAGRLRAVAEGASAWLGGPGLRQSVRGIRRAPVLNGAIVFTVGLGLGGCATMYAIVDVLYLRPLPYAEAERLAWIHTDHAGNHFPLSVADFQALAAQQTTFDDMAAYRISNGTLLVGEHPERTSYLSPTPGLFDVLGIAPLAGRLSSPEDGAPGAEPTVLVTRGFARRSLGAEREDGADRLGATLRLDGVSHRVVGVLPDELGPVVGPAEVFPTLRLELPSRRGPFFLRVVGRRGADATPARVAAELHALNRLLLPVWIDSYREAEATWAARPLAEVLRGDAGRLVGLLMGAVALLLVVATANASNLLLARIGTRRRELSLRSALGATRSQLTGHLLVESLLLAAGGALVGLGIAGGALGVLPGIAGSYLPRLDEAGPGGGVLAFTALLALGCAVLFTGLPALSGGAGRDPAAHLSPGGRPTAGGVREQRAQRILVAGQLAVSVPLLAAAGLLLASLTRLGRLEPGFDTEHVLSARVSISGARYADAGARLVYWRALTARVASLPGVAAVGVANARPPATPADLNNFDLEDDPTPPGRNQPLAHWVIADPGTPDALGVPLLEGRLLRAEDEESEGSVIVVDEVWARRHAPAGSAVGKRLHEGGSPEWTTVVGVVGEVPFLGPGEPPFGTVYAPWTGALTEAYLTVRAAGDPADLAPALRDEVRRLDPTVPVTAVETGTSLVRGALAEPRHLTVTLAVFAGVAMLLAVVGLYGVTANRVQRQRPHIAVRLALGGTPASVLAGVIRDALFPITVGIALGVAATLPASRILRGTLHGIGPGDPGVLAAACGLLLLVSTVATLVPALRAVSVDPASTLREE